MPAYDAQKSIEIAMVFLELAFSTDAEGKVFAPYSYLSSFEEEVDIFISILFGE